MKFAIVTVLLLLGASSFGQTPGVGVVVNKDGSFGLALDETQALKEWDLNDAHSLSIGHSVDAVFGSKLESLPNHLYLDLNGKYERLDWPGQNWMFGAALHGARMEATQSFAHVDFATSVELSLFHSHLFSFVFNALKKDTLEKVVGASPSEVTLGYARLMRLTNRDTLGLGWDSRLDGGVLISIPLRANLGLSLRGRAFNLPSDAFNFGTWKWMIEPAVTFRWGDKWMHVKYERGALPPLYEPVDNWSIGAGFAFD